MAITEVGEAITAASVVLVAVRADPVALAAVALEEAVLAEAEAAAAVPVGNKSQLF